MLISNLLQEKSIIKNTLFGDEMAMKKATLHVSMQGVTYINHFFIDCTFKRDLRESEACLSSTRKPYSLV